MKLWIKILIALALGVVTGMVFGEKTVILKPIGDIFLDLISMIVVLLALSSMTVGITSIHDPEKLGRVGLKTLVLYLATTVIAIFIGISFAYVFNPGEGLHLIRTDEVVVQQPPSVGEILLSVIPSNPIKSLAEGNILQIIVFALFLGISINFAGEKGKPLLEVLESLADVMYRLTSIIMEFSPFGVFAIMASASGAFGMKVLVNLAGFLFTYYGACLAHIAFVFIPLLVVFSRVSPWPFFKGMGNAIMVAFSTCSSAAALPVSMHCVRENLGVSRNISSFVLPLGSTINMNGTAIFHGMAVMFIAQAYGIELGITNLLTIVVVSTLSAIGAAGIPGTGLIMLSMVFHTVGLPMEGIALLAGIDRIREMGSTSLNVLGDAVCAIYVAKQEGELDEQQYYHEELVEMEA